MFIFILRVIACTVYAYIAVIRIYDYGLSLKRFQFQIQNLNLLICVLNKYWSLKVAVLPANTYDNLSFASHDIVKMTELYGKMKPVSH